HADNLGGRRQALTLDLARKRYVPFASMSAAQGDGFGYTFYRSVQHDLNRTDFRKDQSIAVKPNAIAILRVGDAVIAAKTFETRIADLLCAFLHTTEESLKSQIDPELDVLQHLAMHQLELAARLFPAWEHRLDVIQPTLDAVLIGRLAYLKCL